MQKKKVVCVVFGGVMRRFKLLMTLIVFTGTFSALFLSYQPEKKPNGPNCFYHVKIEDLPKVITCRTVSMREPCGLSLVDCDNGVSGVNCAVNIDYYCR